MSAAPEIRVSAAVVTDATGRALVVRKRGTRMFMQPGGKPEAGESAAQALKRELLEEIGAVVDERDLRPLGTFTTAAANEPGHRVVAEAFAVALEAEDVRIAAEIEEARWITADDAETVLLAPLSRDLLLPLVWTPRA
jgi:8-oxo-dGTP diphosphatase